MLFLSVLFYIVLFSTATFFVLQLPEGSAQRQKQNMNFIVRSIAPKPTFVFLTAIYGCREKTVKLIAPQTRNANYFCFTDNASLEAKDPWEIIYIPYHITIGSPLDDGKMLNSLQNNKNPYNIYKYYKMQFHRFPEVSSDSIVVWVDSAIQIINPNFLEEMEILIKQNENMVVAAFQHTRRNGFLEGEVGASLRNFRWRRTTLFDLPQPKQNILGQWRYYQSQGYTSKYWKNMNISRHYGVWTTGFNVWNLKNPKTKDFLDLWFKQNLQFSTQCQIGFSFVAFKLNVLPVNLKGKNVYKNPYCQHVGHSK